MSMTLNGTSGITLPNGGVFPAGYYESAAQSIAAGYSTVTVSHGLGAQPKLFMVTIKCNSTDLGYAVGDEIPLSITSNYAIGGNTVWASSTQIGYVANANFQFPNKGTGTFSTPTYASWRLIFRAWI